MHGHCGDCIPKHANEHANLFCIFIVIILIFYLKGCTLGLCPVLFPNSQCQHRTQQVENTQVNAFPTLFLSQTVNWPCLNLNKGTGELLSILLALRLHRDMYKVIFFFFLFCGRACGMWKFPSWEANLRHSSNPSPCSDNVGSLAHCATRKHPTHFSFIIICVWRGLLNKN